eukprot:403351054
MFKNVLKLKEPLTPYDLEQSLLRPQHDPLCAELMSRLLQKRVVRKDPNGNEIQPKNDNFQVLDYDSWNMMLAKKFSSMHKNYRKFSIRYLGKDPLYNRDQVVMQEDQNYVENLEEVKLEELIQQNQNPDQQQQNEELKESYSQTNQNGVDQVQIVTLSNQEEEKKDSQNQQQSAAMQTQITERMTRSRLAKLNNPQASQSQTTINQSAKKTTKKAGKLSDQIEPKIEEKQVVVEQVWSSDIREHLLKQHREENITIRFSHEAAVGYVGQQNQWKTESLQILKLFNEELEGLDPFYIEGQDWNQQQKEEQTNYWSNFVDTEAIEDFDDFQYQNQLGSKQIEVLFRKYHEIPTQQRLSILYFLCQNKIDSESPEFMQEIQSLHQTRPPKFEGEDGLPLKMSDELKLWLEPINMGLLKPLGTINKYYGPFTQEETTVELQPGHYFYFPYFSDTRIYRQSLDQFTFELYLEDYNQIQVLLALLRENENEEDCFKFLEKLVKFADCLKKAADDMKWRDATKARKLKSQIRSRKLQDLSRKKLQFEGRQNQLQTDYLHHAQGNVMTRRQIDTVKQKYVKGGKQQQQEESEEEYGNKRQSGREKGGMSAREKYQEQLKQRHEKEKQDRQRRLEKRMRLKERITGGGSSLGKRKRGGQNSDEEESYFDEYDEEQNTQGKQNAAQGSDQEQQEEQKAEVQYDIVLNGDLIMIFQRDEQNPNQIINTTMVIKGNWKLSIEEFQEEFIYKKINAPMSEELLTQLFCEKPEDKVSVETVKIQAPSEQLQSIIDQFLSCQGLYQGYFKYNEQDVTENFSFILRKPSNLKKANHFDICGYGENNIGPFTMEGSLSLNGFEKLQEKGGVKNFIKLKLGKFHMKKQYKKVILEELVEEVNMQRNPQQQFEIDEDMPAEYRDLLMMQTPEKFKKRAKYNPMNEQPIQNQSQDDIQMLEEEQLPQLPSLKSDSIKNLLLDSQIKPSSQLSQLMQNSNSDIMNPSNLNIEHNQQDLSHLEQASQNIVPHILFSQILNKSIEEPTLNKIQHQNDTLIVQQQLPILSNNLDQSNQNHQEQLNQILEQQNQLMSNTGNIQSILTNQILQKQLSQTEDQQ